jgi:hypothetical protein
VGLDYVIGGLIIAPLVAHLLYALVNAQKL